MKFLKPLSRNDLQQLLRGLLTYRWHQHPKYVSFLFLPEFHKKAWFWSNSIDVMVLASAYLATRRPDMENFKLSTVAKTLGVNVDNESLHNALYDIRLTKAVFDIVTRNDFNK